MLPACLSQPLFSTTPPSTKKLPEHIHGPSEHLRPTASISFPPPPYCEPAWFGTSHMQPHAPITRIATHSSAEPTHSPPVRERRGCETESWPAWGEEGEEETMSIVTNSSPTPWIAVRETLQKLNSAATIKVTTHCGPTPHRPARASIEPSYSLSTTWSTTLQQKPSQVTNKQSQATEMLEEKAQAEKPKSQRNEEWNRGGEDYIFRAIGIVPGAPHARPLHHLHPPPYFNPSFPTSTLRTTLPTTLLTHSVRAILPSTDPVQGAGVGAPASSLSPPNEPFGFEFDLPPFPPLLLGVLIAGLISGVAAAVVLYFVNFPPISFQYQERGEGGWKSVGSASSASGATSTATSPASSPELEGLRSRARAMTGTTTSPQPPPGAESTGPHRRNLSSPSHSRTRSNSPARNPDNQPPTPNWNDIPLLPLPALRTSSRQSPSPNPSPNPSKRPTRRPTPLDPTQQLGLRPRHPAQPNAPPAANPASRTHSGAEKARGEEHGSPPATRVSAPAPAPAPTSAAGSASAAVSTPRSPAPPLAAIAAASAAFGEEARTPLLAPRAALLAGGVGPGEARLLGLAAAAGGGWLEGIDGVVERAVGRVMRWTAEGGEGMEAGGCRGRGVGLGGGGGGVVL